MKHLTIILLVVACAVCASAQPSANLEKEKAELLRLHKLDREAHFKTDLDLLLQTAPEEFISVSRGKISRSSKADDRKMFAQYFRDAKYYEWDDMEEPIIRISNDATMAWMITRTRIRRVQKNAAGGEGAEGRVRGHHDLREARRTLAARGKRLDVRATEMSTAAALTA